MGWWSKASPPAPGEKFVTRKGQKLKKYVHEDLFGARWVLTIAERNKKNRCYCDWPIKVSKEFKSFYPHGEKEMSDADKSTAVSRIDTMIKILDAMKQEILND